MYVSLAQIKSDRDKLNELSLPMTITGTNSFHINVPKGLEIK